MSNPGKENCPQCDRQIYDDRPACMYCGHERALDSGRKLQMKKQMVANTLGIETFEADNISEEDSAQEPATVPAVAVCPKCQAERSSKSNFCTSCGFKLENAQPVEPRLNESKTHVLNRPEVKSQFRPLSLSSISPNFDPGILLMPHNVLWIASILFFLLSLQFPFGIVPGETTALGTHEGWTIGFPTVLWILYPLSFIFMILDNVELVVVMNTRRVFTAIHLLEIAICIFLAKEIFTVFSAFIVLAILFAAIHFYFKKLLTQYNPEHFWTFAAMSAAVTIVLLTPYIRTEMLSDTTPGLFRNPGFTLHMLAALVMLAGCIVRKSRIPKCSKS